MSGARDLFEMNRERHAHLKRLLAQSETLIRVKYVRGQEEHGGDLWLKDGILDMAIDEAVDLLVYLLTLREQRARVEGDLPTEGVAP